MHVPISVRITQVNRTFESSMIPLLTAKTKWQVCKFLWDKMTTQRCLS